MKHKLIAVLTILLFIGAAAYGSGESDGGGATTGVTSGKYTQSPFLDSRVASGELPPVDDRLPLEPLVRKGEEIGTYGGRLTVFSNGPNPWAPMVGENPEGAPSPVFMGLDESLEPGLAKDWDLADDYMSMTIYLREGAKWSNGDPFTAEDFTFFQKLQQQELGDIWGLPAQVETVTAVDEYTVRYDYNKPFAKHLWNITTYKGSDWTMYAASDWLKQWHAEYNPDAQAKAKEEGYNSWQEALTDHNRFCCPQVDYEKPSMYPFILTEVANTFRLKERNPYYIGVDAAGQQLPYIDTALNQQVENQTIPLKVIAGEADWHDLGLEHYPLLVQSAEQGNYKVQLYENWFEGCGLAFAFNYNTKDPLKKELFNTVNFRRAMSLAIDKERINEIQFLGQGVVSAHTITHLASYYKPEWGETHPYVRHDPDEAGRMLDALGLDGRDSDGFRTWPNGEKLTIWFGYGGDKPSEAYELVKEDFDSVGMRTELRTNSWDAVHEGGNIDFVQWNETFGEMQDYLTRIGGFAQMVENNAYEWNTWWQEKWRRHVGVSDETGPLPGEEMTDKALDEFLMTEYESKDYPYQHPEQIRLSSKAWDIAAENMWMIGVIQNAPRVIVYRENLTNLVLTIPPNAEGAIQFNQYVDLAFYKN